ncbi:hypothetical protein IPG36_07600 [bacterium]|nr:MAG: hypothetical protein IPG36_07600 [bacterium]
MNDQSAVQNQVSAWTTSSDELVKVSIVKLDGQQPGTIIATGGNQDDTAGSSEILLQNCCRQ